MKKNRRYRITTPTIAITSYDGVRKTVTVPVNETVTVIDNPRDGDRLIDVVWKEELYQMFTQDLRDRGEEVSY